MNLPVEDLPELARHQFANALRLCRTCRPYHMLWPYMRLGGQIGGVEADEPTLGPILGRLLAGASRHVVLAGSADSGVLAMVHRAALAGGVPHRYTVVDRCATPLHACREFADRFGLDVATRVGDLRGFGPELAADLIIGHSVMPFFGEEDRGPVLQALRSALAPGGRLVTTVRITSPDRDKEHSREPAQWARTMLEGIVARLSQLGMPLPCPTEEFEAMLRAWVESHSFHATHYDEPRMLREHLEAAGFTVEDVLPVGRATDFLKDGQVKPVRQGIVAITAPR